MAAQISLALLLAISFAQVSSAFPVRTVALTGAQAPGALEGWRYSNMSQPAINAVGEVAFSGFARSPGANPTFRSGKWSEGGGSLHKIFLEGDPAPGVSPPDRFELGSATRINLAGQSALSVGLSDSNALYLEENGTLTLLVRTGQAAHGLAPDVSYSRVGQSPVVDDRGHVTFAMLLDVPGLFNAAGIWSNRSGEIAPVVVGYTLPSPPPTAISGVDSFRMNGSGELAYLVQYGNGQVTGVRAEGDGVTFEIAQTGLPAAGFPDGYSYARLDGPTINDAGHVAFTGGLTGPSIDPSNDKAIWEGGPDGLRVVSQLGAQAPGADSAANFSRFYWTNLNGEGGVTFVASLTGPSVTENDDVGLWSEVDSELKLIVREGEPAPGAPLGATFGSLSPNFLSNFVPHSNARGQVAFTAPLTGADITPENDQGLWVTNLAGEPQLVVCEGDLFDVNDDPLINDFRTISRVAINNITSSGGEDGLGSALNASGQLTMYLSFTDFSAGIFVVETLVPEPSSAATSILTLALLAAVRRRQPA
ncbi:hypothetical protein Pla123a_36850 [Posidoniimonas polymericola]|uniref:PEP-CTERM protein-sorting domain-containing protein n=1 Tax=Posidoniimonas polymericola TaxID=2528002 RepID=A0A5C5YGS6_9BACT|nr:choice-of-anchor tandem repeat NxxGxxAF-containing protein [Posidoniimonas polymericola]TWT73791.1 hypothetical protein Pla123a_36850 [Posidoniimonas polymericola]